MSCKIMKKLLENLQIFFTRAREHMGIFNLKRENNKKCEII